MRPVRVDGRRRREYYEGRKEKRVSLRAALAVLCYTTDLDCLFPLLPFAFSRLALFEYEQNCHG
jgi:hypothetical protein